MTLPDDMDEEKAKYCKAKQKELAEIKFDEIYEHLHLGSQKAIMSFKPVHLSFFCMLCDYRAHNEFNLQGKREVTARPESDLRRDQLHQADDRE